VTVGGVAAAQPVCHDGRSVSSLIRRISPPCLLASIALLVAAPSGSAAAATCKLSVKTSQQLGATYVTNLKVRGVSCAGGRRIAKAFNGCRRATGVKGRCTRKVLKYACADRRPASEQIPTQFNGHVTCKRGDRRVTFDYQQNT
jgi:uncharacterized ParB-like nuclease family protein